VTFLGVVLGPILFGALSGALGTYRFGFAALAVATALSCLALLRKPVAKASPP
jgi:MFS-type transporter involved in bile tolerance (Atg22 family)